MQAYNSAALERAVTDDCTDLSARAARALTEKMTVLPDAGRVKDAADLYLVISESGSEYLVDAREGVCECADFRHREPAGGCKHLRRVGYATGETAIPEWADADAVDPHLGMHTEAMIRGEASTTFSEYTSDVQTGEEVPRTDGGVSTEKVGETPADATASANAPAYTYHHESAHVGGARYVRCEACGAECIPAKPEQMLHREGCSEGDR